MSQSKNSRHNRGAHVKKRVLDGKVVRPVKYVGRHIPEHGTYISGTTTEGNVFPELVRDEGGRPLPYRQIGRVI